MIPLFVFDLDGTLVDSLRDLADSANELLAACGAPPLGEAAIGDMVGEGAATLVTRAFALAGVARPADALDRFLAIYDTKLLNHTRPYEGIADVLGALGARASLALLTNKPIGATKRILEGVELARFFDEDAIVGGDGLFPRKPDPAGLLHLCARAAVGTDLAMLVGDSPIDLRTAQNAGTRICLARYGFGFRGFGQDELATAGAVIDAPQDLLAL